MEPASQPATAAALLIAAVSELSRYATGQFDVDDLLRQLSEVAAHALRVDGVGVMGSDGAHTRFVHSSAPLTDLERLQEVLQDGPCMQAIQTRCPVVADLAGMQRWPSFHQEAVNVGIRSVLVFPLLARDRSWGTLDLYRITTTDDWSPADVAAGRLLTNLAVSYLVMTADRNDLRQAKESLAVQLIHDPLTGLPNRVLAAQLVEHALAAALRHQTVLTVLFIDIDRFKTINDSYGHFIGDEVLKTVASRMAAALRGADTVARLGGDEFLVLCEDLPGIDTDLDKRKAAIAELTGRLRAAVSKPISLAQRTLTITLSIGVAISDGHDTAQTLIHDADTAMYQAKAGGRDRISFHQPTTPPTQLPEQAKPQSQSRGQIPTF